MLKTVAQINQAISLDDKTLDALKGVDGNVYIINNNSGNVQTQTNLSDCVMDMYKQGIGLHAMLEKVRHLACQLALSDCKTQYEACKRLNVTERTFRGYLMKGRRQIKYEGIE